MECRLAHADLSLALYLQLFYSNPVLKRYKGNASLDVLVHFVSGGLAGMTAASATYPLDLVRTRLSAQVIVLFINSF